MSDPSPSTLDPSPSTTSMEEDEQRGMKRTNDGSDALLPTEATQQANSQEERQQDGDVQMQDVAVASPNKVDDDATKMATLNQIIENVLAEHSNARFLTNWTDLGTPTQAIFLGQVVDACKDFTSMYTFSTLLKTNFNRIFKNDDFLAVFASAVYNECVRTRLIVERKDLSTRVVTITHGLNQGFLGTFDLTAFQKHIDEVWKWHKTDHKKYISPSFAMVQSSGMGKTKLMRQYYVALEGVKASDIQCKVILCMGSDMQEEPPDFGEYYQAKLKVPVDETDTAEGAKDIMLQLGEIEKACTKKKVILFFDEAQMLLPGSSVGFYHTVLWWLRQVRTTSFVAVFAGTLLGLSKFQVVNARSQFSRDDKQSFMNYDPNKPTPNLLLYAPFYSLTTISISRSHMVKDDVHDELKDIRKYGCNGRPLFAAMLRRQGLAVSPALTLSEKDIGDGITNPTMYSILRRLMLSPNEKEPWESQYDSIASVLGTRVQLGLGNYDFVNNATSSGYAMLVRYDTPDSDHHDGWKKFGSVAIVFPPDPVCAALAMGLMQPDWALRKNEAAEIRGKDPKFWVKKMATLFDQHFCLPSRGDSGEVFAALYMLLCGDALRYKQDPYMRLFEVDLVAWLVELHQEMPENSEGPKEPAPPMEREKAEVRRSSRLKAADMETMDMEKEKDEENMTSLCSTDCKLSLNFIQVCRNYFRSHAWFDQSMLEYMYDTATGCYVYPLCPAIDIVFPIKKGDANETSYHPCLVSVKCWDAIGRKGMKDARTSMENYLKKYRPKESTTALCLLIVIGTSRAPRESPEREGCFPTKDSYISIVVPSSDKFGVNDTIQNMSSASHISELLASHSFAYAENHVKALRRCAKGSYLELGRELLEDKLQIWTGQNQPNEFDS